MDTLAAPARQKLVIASSLALLIFAEKLFPRGLLVSRLSGIVLLGLGLAVVLTAL